MPIASTIRIQHALEGGWNLHVEVDGEVVATEHADDWHRVERRRALLTLEAGAGIAIAPPRSGECDAARDHRR